MSPVLTPLPPEAVRARRRPRAIAYVFLAELACALLIATPVHAWARRVWGAHPDGDAVLWIPGGRDLLVWLGQEDAALGVVSRTSLVLLVVSTVVMQVPLGALIASLAFANDGSPGEAGTPAPRRALPWQSAMRIGLGAFMPLAGLLAIGSVVAILVLALGGMASSAMEHAVTERLGDARAFTLRLVTFALFALLAAVIGVVVDLARAAIGRDVGLAARDGIVTPGWTTMLRGIRTALRVARTKLLLATTAWAARMAMSLGLLVIGLAASQALGGKGGGALLLLWCIHQAIVLVRVALRASWLARAVALVAPVQDARDSRAASAAPLGQDARDADAPDPQ